MENTETILEGNSEQEKGAYLVAIASIATADKQASEEELGSLTTLCEAAQLNEAQTAKVMEAASDPTGSGLQESLEILKSSELRFSLVADLIAFAKSDSDYSEEEQQSVHKIANFLGVNQQQFEVLDEVANNTSQAAAEPENQRAGLFGGIEDKLKGAGINGGSLLKGLLAVAAPILLSKMMSGRRNSSTGGMFGGNNRGGMFGGSGGLLGGLAGGAGGGLLGNLAGGGGGGLGSIIGMFNGNRGFGNAGSLLGKIFGRR